MKNFSLVLLIAALFIPTYSYGYAQAPPPPCPCDTEELPGGLTGDEIIDIVCPNGKLGVDSEFVLIPEEVRVSLASAPSTTYRTDEPNVDDFFCEINTDGVLPITLEITEQQYELCRARLIIGCGLNMKPVPTLSEWGLIAMAGVLGIVGLLAVRRRAVA